MNARRNSDHGVYSLVGDIRLMREWLPESSYCCTLCTPNWDGKSPWDGTETDLVIVNSRSYPTFVDLARKYQFTHGHRPNALLLLEKGDSMPADAWRWIDMTNSGGRNHPLLVDSLRCPKSFSVLQEVKGTTPAHVFDLLAQTGLNPDQLPISLMPVVGRHDRDHLVTCGTYQERFGRALKKVMQERRHELPVTPAELLEYEIEQVTREVEPLEQATDRLEALRGELERQLGAQPQEQDRSRPNLSGSNGLSGMAPANLESVRRTDCHSASCPIHGGLNGGQSNRELLDMVSVFADLLGDMPDFGSEPPFPGGRPPRR